MKKLIMSLWLNLFVLCAFSQNNNDDRANSYAIAKSYYNNKDYLNAYKFLLIYKWSHYDQLNKPENSSTKKSIESAIDFCEAQIKNGLSESATFIGMGWADQTKDSTTKIIQKKKPSLPTAQP